MTAHQTMPAFADGERRAVRRTRVLKSAVLHFNHACSAMECIVRNQSPDGALLVFGDAVGVPRDFDLTIGSDAPRPAHVMWRKGTTLGVSLG